jgi:hypothetical protein
VARGLSLEGGDAYALAHQQIHQRALANVRITYDIYKTGFMHFVYRS